MIKNRYSRVWALALIVLMLCALLPGAAMAQDASLQATLGFNGQAYIGFLTPVVVDVAAGDQPIEGTLSVVINGTDGRPVESVAAISLAPGAKKRVTMYVKPVMTQKQIPVRLISNAGRELARQELPATRTQLQEVATAMIGVLGTDDGSSAFLSPAHGSQALNNMNTLRLQAQNMPEQAQALLPFGLIVVSSSEIAALSPIQLQALKQWVQGGGVLVAGIGPDGKDRVASLASIVDGLQMAGTQTVQAKTFLQDYAGKAMASDAALPIAQLSGAGSTVLQLGDTPLVTAAQVDTGMVFISAFDLSLDPLTDWPGMTPLFDRLLTENLPANAIRTTNGARSNMDYAFINALGNINALKMPSFAWMALLLAVYLILAIPVSYIILKKKDKREWMWVAVPAWALVFSLTIYFVGVADRGSQSIISQLGVVNIGRDTASMQMYTGVFTSSRGNVQVRINTDAQVSSVVENNYTRDSSLNEVQTGASGMVIRHDGDSSQVLINDLQMWTMGTVSWRENRPLDGGIHSEITMKDGVVTGQLRNDTPWAIEDAAVYIGRGYQVLGTLMPGQTVQIDLQQDASNNYRGYDIFYDMVGDIYSNIQYGQGDAREARRTLMQNFSPMETGAYDTETGCVLLGFTQDITYPDVMINGAQPRRELAATMVQSQLTYQQSDDGSFETPVGGISFIPQDDNIASGGKFGQEMYLGVGEYDLSISLARYLSRGVVEKGAIDVNVFYGTPKFQLANGETGEFEDITLPMELDEQTFAGYVDAQGIIRMRIIVGASSTDREANLTIPTITIAGRGN